MNVIRFHDVLIQPEPSDMCGFVRHNQMQGDNNGNKYRAPGGLRNMRRACDSEGGLPMSFIDLSMALICALSAQAHLMYFQVETNGKHFQVVDEW